MCRNNEQSRKRQVNGETWSRGTNLRLPFVVNVMLDLSIVPGSRCEILKGAMSHNTHARANENKLEKDGPTFSSCVGDFGRLFLSV